MRPGGDRRLDRRAACRDRDVGDHDRRGRRGSRTSACMTVLSISNWSDCLRAQPPVLGSSPCKSPLRHSFRHKTGRRRGSTG
jgi:hypothetical protein